MYCHDDFTQTPWRNFSVTCHVVKVTSYIDKFVFQDFKEVFFEQKNDTIHSSAFPDRFQLPGKIAANRLRILYLDIINIALNMTPIYMLRCVVPDDM